jgi:hypothetical protein
MEDAMLNSYRRILIGAVLLSLISSIVVALVGLISGWKTTTEFSNGFFWAGILLIGIGSVNVMARYYQPTDTRMQHSQSAVHLSADERFKIWQADLTRGHHFMAFMGIAGLLLFGIAELVVVVGRML